jgi:hypothetical protein
MTTLQTDPQHEDLCSFIIPCLNEEEFIGDTVARIHECVPEGINYEIIVADHGSVDQSPLIAERLGARVIRASGTSLGGLRNAGARAARGSVLIYLDADTSLTPAWTSHIHGVVQGLSRSHPQLTGSMAVPEPDSTWVSQTWESGRSSAGPVRTLSGAHLIIRRDQFFLVGGFPEEVDAGEDEGLSARVWKVGGEVLADPRLEVVHRGSPATVSDFFHRQFWHGLGDANTLGRLVRSATALTALLFLVLHGVLISAAILADLRMVIGSASAVGAIPLASAWRRTRKHSDASIWRLLALYWVYYWARGLAVMLRPLGLASRRKRRLSTAAR